MRDRVFVQMALVLMLLVTACSQTPAPRSTPSPASDKVVTIRVGLYDNEPSLDAVIAAFQDKYPYYRVEQVQLGMPIDSMERLKKGEVDVVSDALTVGMLHLEGVATSLDPFIAKSRIDLAPYGAPLESLRIDGHIYGMPVWSDPYMFAYNKQLVDAATVALPTTTWTWEDLRDLAARLTRASGDAKIWGFDPEYLGEDLVYMRAIQTAPAGGLPDANGYRQALQLFNTMVANDRSMVPAPPLADGASIPPYCRQNQAAICMVKLSAFMKNKLFADFRMLPFPAASQGKPVALTMTRAYTILGQTPEPEAAWAFLSFLSGPEGAVIMARQGYFPAYFTDATQAAWLESSPPPPAEAKSLLNASWSTLPRDVYLATPTGTLIGGARDVLSGAASVDEAVAKYDAVLKKPR